MGEERRREIHALTADTTLGFPGYNGTLITNEGAIGTVVITLPAGSEALRGSWVEVYVSVAQTVQVKTATVDTLGVYGDVKADSIAWSGAAKVGNSAVFTCLGAATSTVPGWICQLMPAVSTTTFATSALAS